MDMSIRIGDAKETFVRHFGGAPEVVVRAPGRVNIIGEHTDYNRGFVLPTEFVLNGFMVSIRGAGDELMGAVALVFSGFVGAGDAGLCRIMGAAVKILSRVVFFKWVFNPRGDLNAFWNSSVFAYH